MKTTLKIFAFITFLMATAACSSDDDTSTNLPPSAPLLLTPENEAGPCFGTGLTPGTATLTWEASVDPENDSIRYRVFLDGNSNPTTVVVSGITDTFFTLPNDSLEWGEQYFWRVEAIDAEGNIKQSEVFTFFALTLC